MHGAKAWQADVQLVHWAMHAFYDLLQMVVSAGCVPNLKHLELRGSRDVAFKWS